MDVCILVCVYYALNLAYYTFWHCSNLPPVMVRLYATVNYATDNYTNLYSSPVYESLVSLDNSIKSNLPCASYLKDSHKIILNYF